MNINEKLESKKAVNYIKNLQKELKEQAEKGIISSWLTKPKLKKEVAELGLLLLGKDEYDNELTLGSEKANKIKSFLKQDIWEDPNYYQHLIYLFGAHADLL